MTRDLFYYLMAPLLLIASLLQSTAATRLQVGGVKPDLVLLLVVSGTLLYGSKAGIVWAFVGGLALDIFSGGPMGGSSLALMVATFVIGLGQRTLSRFNVLVPLGAAMLGTLLYGVTYVALLSWVESVAKFLALSNAGSVRYNLAFWPTLQFIILPALFYNTTLMLFVTPLLNRMPERPEAMNT
jgi:rod shape-determining protein MreD